MAGQDLVKCVVRAEKDRAVVPVRRVTDDGSLVADLRVGNEAENASLFRSDLVAVICENDHIVGYNGQA
jgi:hypothetical protein